MKTIAILLALIALTAGLAPANTPPEVTNVVATQRPHTALIDVTFDLTDADGDALHVTLWYSLDGGDSWDHECETVSGDVGPGIMPAAGLGATWDAGADEPNFTSEQFTLRVYADDGSGGVPAGFVRVEAGSFLMGSPQDELGRESDESQHPVTLTQDFYMSRYEVTEEWWYQVMGGTPTTSRSPKRNVSWDMAIQFCNALSVQEDLTPAYTIHGPNGWVSWDHDANGYRLPTEAEWEYACRAGSATAFANGPITQLHCDPIDPNLNVLGWYCGNRSYEDGPADVGQKQANPWGLYDLHGNVYEWVWDGYQSDYEDLPSEDPVRDGYPGELRVTRGGSWNSWAGSCRSAFRQNRNYPDAESSIIGFRPVRSAF